MRYNLFARLVILALATFGAWSMAAVAALLWDAALTHTTAVWALISAPTFLATGFLFAYQPGHPHGWPR